MRATESRAAFEGFDGSWKPSNPARLPLVFTLTLALATLVGGCAVDQKEPVQAVLPTLDLPNYMGEWHQIAHIPNRFQASCLSDTKATYRLLKSGEVEVLNECQTKSGPDSVVGAARPRAGATLQSGQLQPATLEVTFAPGWIRWAPLVWANYDVVYLSADTRVAIVTEPSRRYMWVLSRSSSISEDEWMQVERRLKQLGFQRDQWVKDSA